MRPWRIITGDVRQIARTLEPESFDAICCDPPYGLRFMGARWDYDVPSVNVWASLLRALRPGAHAVIFGGTRTFHRLCVAVEDGGFEIRDLLMWLYGSGFPKSLDISKAIDKKLGVERTKVLGHKQSGLDRGSGASVSFSGSSGRDESGLIPIKEPATEDRLRWQGQGTALKPSYEPAILARRRPIGSLADNALEHGVGGLAIDASRIPYVSDDDQAAAAAAAAAQRATADQNAGRTAYGRFENGAESLPGYFEKQALGRWPSNVVLDEESAAILDAEVGDRPGMSGGGKHREGYAGGMFGSIDAPHLARGDNGGPSRFFYSAKVSRSERDAGCDDLSPGSKGVGALRDGGRSHIEVTDGFSGNPKNRPSLAAQQGQVRNDHVTLKPIDLIRYFARLILPPERADGKPRRILVPYSGSGSEIIGCLLAGWDEVVGIELSPKYVKIAEARIAKGRIFERHQRRR